MQEFSLEKLKTDTEVKSVQQYHHDNPNIPNNLKRLINSLLFQVKLLKWYKIMESYPLKINWQDEKIILSHTEIKSV